MKTRSSIYVCSLVMILALLLSGCGAAPGDAATMPPPSVVTTTPVAPSLPAEVDVPADWQAYYDNIYGFRIAYPADWQYKVQQMGGPGMPDDWPVKSVVSFFPAAMAEAMNQQGPPDPNAPPAIPPFSIEILVGPMEQFRRVYPEPGRIEEGLEINGASMVVERDTFEDYNSVRYVFSHPNDPSVYVVLLDVISGFSQRAAANPEYLDVIARVIASLEFTGEQPPSSDQENSRDAIRLTIAAMLNTDPGTLDLILQATEFPDACLGLPAEGEMCAQMLTPGYGGEVRVGDTVYEVRASQDGQRVLLCNGTECVTPAAE